MASIEHVISPTVMAIDAAWEANGNTEKGHRAHLGASILGTECLRALWYSFRWCTDQRHSGRLLRLFNRGQNEEARFISDLRAAGVIAHDVDDRTGQQFRFSDVGGHVGGSMDGVAIGIKESPNKWHVLEFKTHNDKSFQTLIAQGVEKAKPEHFAQMQLYMHWSGIDRAFYMAVNKNDDSLHTERVRYDQKIAENLLRKANDVVRANSPLPRMTEDPTFYKCKFCNHSDVCHQNAAPAINCRTCVHSEAVLDNKGTWSCALNDSIITTDQQRIGCDKHLFIPDLVTWLSATQVDASDTENWIEYQLPDGRRFRNGPRGKDSYPSIELVNLPTEIVGDSNLSQIRKQFDGWVVPA